MKALKILVVLTAIVVITGLTADAWAANCIPGRQFRSLGKPTTDTTNVRIGVDGTGADNTTHMIGRIWDSDDANNANTGLTDLNGDGTGFGSFCPVANFYTVAGTERKIDEFMGSTTPRKRLPGPKHDGRYRRLRSGWPSRSRPDRLLHRLDGERDPGCSLRTLVRLWHR
jgi:hypothetical protein